MIQKLLIANRGEIACRIIRTAREMGITTVAVYSDADAKALHVRSADEAVHIGPSPAAESYLVGEKIIAAAKQTRAQAIHPGYGFLSENADFAQAVKDAGLIWVGAPPSSIRAMGLKDAAKKLMREAGVPVTPGYDGDDQSAERLRQEADAIGYPVLIKAVAGGGGKGMRKVDAEGDFLSALESCRREAKASFGNDDVILEKWITSPRHIEVQVFGDSHGNHVHLFERDCSLQRRHQKVIEEAPAPGMDEATREEICSAAVRAAKAVDYEGAGTIEFIADASEGLRADRIFFMEMNTRLQVEHPVTEEITGVDLVEWQLRVAAGEPIPKKQDELSIAGWAIEARLYAEDPSKGFLPSTGPLHHLDLGHEGRIETGVEEGDEISPHYDPMVAKLVAWGETRDDAIDQLIEMTDGVEIWSVRTNAAFLGNALGEDDFADAQLDTGFIEAKGDALLADPEPNDAIRAAAADIALLAAGVTEQPMAGFRLNRPLRLTVALGQGGEFTTVDPAEAAPFEPLPGFADDARVVVFADGQAHEFDLAARGGGALAASDGAILAPMPGKVIAVDVADGASVTAGQRLMVLEAMKMEHALTAPFDGTVTQLVATEGAQVQVEAVLCVVEPASED
ncbi:acetyl/propionyl/methylcrotonyl-CoA carboxylase subunit alpha [Alteriqipengyuania lutimaris]|uniref:Acetyl/propionyl/methylcrotonyl-CoA carboxylase subunit alpha n=1 Tax=Alteriqipengyuania lutimaris TaxID=1538146 RepID=A0A395LHX8_9SPHN|nr:acetyl/propionyl/methylcrotonyl-CoA carboxylase subunit alpha [Alteriqipengyuania lutimaris]MBB3034923.1 3-methylcrotonyl-CoA carboxylase alpha subunit [Alteriqipengyuania lutimaris]RDS76249.1 acetyl/propionyl/methylcrotonyl-CoA carboxylase subunit alpha [Alteriqipengyuania lutimaris]